MAGKQKEGGQSGPLLPRRDILKLGGGAAAAVLGGTWAATRNSDRPGTGRDPGAAPAGNNDSSTPDQKDQGTDNQQDEQKTEEPDDEPTFDIETPVEAPFYDDSVKNADPQNFNEETAKLRNAVEQGGHQGAVQIGELFKGQTDADSAYAAAKILHQNGNTDYIIDTIPGQINASDQEYIFIQPVQNGQLLEPVVAGEAYNGFEVYNPENPEASSHSMGRLVDDGDYELSLTNQIHSLERLIESVGNSSRGDEEEREEAQRGGREMFFDDWSSLMLGVSPEDDYLLRPVHEKDWDAWDDSRFHELSYGDIAGELQDQYEDSDHYDNGEWTGFELEMNGGEADYSFTNDVQPGDSF